LFFNLKADDIGIFIAARDIIHRYGETLTLRIRTRYRREKVGGERSNAALSWQMVTNKSNFVNF